MTEQKMDDQLIEDLEQQEQVEDLNQSSAQKPTQHESNHESSTNDAQDQGDSIEDIRLKEAMERYDQLYQRYLRLTADYDNYRKRTMKEKEDAAKYAASSLLEKLLPVVDNFERAIASAKHTNNVETLVQGLEMIYRQLMEALKAEGAYPIESVGKPFDPFYHQAVMQEQSDEHESGIVLEEFQKGYMLKDKVIRPAMVKVTT